MKNISRFVLALSIPLMLAACNNGMGGGENGGISGGGTGTGGNLAPSVSLATSTGAAVSSGVRVSGNPQFVIKAADSDGSIVAVKWQLTSGSTVVSNGTIPSADIKASIPLEFSGLAKGSYTLVVTATDNTGLSSSSQVNFVVDATAPSFGTVTLNGNTITDNGSFNILVGAPAKLSVVATDDSGAALITVYNGDKVIARGTNKLDVDLTASAAGSSNYTIVTQDSAGNVTTKNFGVTSSTSTSQTAAPAPIININNTGAQPYANVLSVTVSAGVAAGVGVKQVILQVTDSKGIVDTTTYTSTSENPTFNIDTTKYPDGDLKLQAIAVDAKDQRGSSIVSTVQVANTVAPTITIINPASGSNVTGPTNVVVQIRQNNTAFTFPDNSVYIDVIDSRGQVVTTVKAPIASVNTGLWQATTLVDFNQTQYLNGKYTLKARSSVTLANETSAREIIAVTDVTNQSTPDEPPALVVLMPSFFDATGTTPPVLTRKSAVAVQVSDSDNIEMLQLQFVCDAAKTVGCSNTVAFQYNVPVGQAGIHYEVFNTGYLIDSQPFVPDGNYIMRVTAKDVAGHANIKEMPVVVNRNATLQGISSSAGKLTATVTTPYDNGVSKFVPTSATWIVGNGLTTNATRVLTIEDYAGETKYYLNSQLSSGSQIGNSLTFGKTGFYNYSYLVQDLNTGIVEYFQGTGVEVTNRQ